MNILIIGTGMYVSGSGTGGYGTVLPAIVEWQRGGGKLGKVYLAGTDRKRSLLALDKAKSLQKLTGVSIDIDVYPDHKQTDREAYKVALETIENLPVPS